MYNNFEIDNYLKVIPNIWNRSIWPIDETLTGITTPGQSGPGSNGKEAMTLYSSKFSNWSLITVVVLCYTKDLFFVRESYPLAGDIIGIF